MKRRGMSLLQIKKEIPGGTVLKDLLFQKVYQYLIPRKRTSCTPSLERRVERGGPHR